MTDRLEAMLAGGRDSALLRFSLGTEYAKGDAHDSAIEHLRQAVVQDSNYAAAWKLLGKTLADSGEIESARAAFESGIAAAEATGAKQAAKEMMVFVRRLDKQRGE
jgi:predicted Zn-dependent protease